MKNKVCIIGHFGGDKICLDGQTIKTKIITAELKKQLGENQVNIFDTYGGKKTLLKCFFKTFSVLKNNENIIMFPAHNGVRFFAPVLLFWNIFFHRKLHNSVIGGWLPEFLQKRKRLAKQLKRFDGIYVETNTMKSALEAQGFENVYVMPNCKNLQILTPEELVYPSGEPYKLCTFSRVMKEKGIEDAVKAVKQVNEESGRTVYTLDIYGQVDPNQTQWFEDLKQSFPEYVQYCGVVDYDKSVEVLKNYFALLFPTYYKGEGFAGTLLDAFSAGVPVIASDWKYNAEIVNDNVGFVYSIGDVQVFFKLLKSIAENPAMLLDKKPQCLIEAEKYRTENVVKILAERLEE